MRPAKIITLSLASFVLMAGLCGCDMLAYRKFHSAPHRFTILLPRLWLEAKDIRAAVMVKAPPDGRGDKFLENINVMANQLAAKVPLETYVDYNKEELLRVMPKATDMRSSAAYLGLVPGRVITFSNDVDGVVLQYMMGVWMKDNRVYVVTCTGEAKRFKKYQPIFNYVLHSLRIQ